MYNVSPKGVTAYVTCRSNPDPNPTLTHFIRLMQAMYDALMCLVKEQRVRCVGGYTIQL